MTLSNSLDINKHDSVVDWVSAAAEETGVDEEVLWNVTEKLLLEPESVEGKEKELRLKVLYELHLNRWTNNNDNPPASWIEVAFPVDGEILEGFKFSFGAFNVPLEGDEERIEAMKAITRDEGLHVQMNEPEFIYTESMDCDPVWALRVTRRILNEVYGVSVEEVKWAEEEVTWGDNLTWEDVVEYR